MVARFAEVRQIVAVGQSPSTSEAAAVGGETHFTRYGLRPFFLNPCLPILQSDPVRGGLTDLRKIAVLADTWGITIAPHSAWSTPASRPSSSSLSCCR
jgi:L-alanine-DL-glutamate epimerase-like enolase superfamily enzyme